MEASMARRSHPRTKSDRRIAVPDVERVRGQAVTLKWCPLVRREYAALDSSSDATPYSEIVIEGSTPLDDPTRTRKLLKMLSTGTHTAAITMSSGRNLYEYILSMYRVHG